MLVLGSFHYVNWNRQDNTWPTSETLVDQQLVNWSSTRHYDYIYTLWSSLSPEEKKKKRNKKKEGGERERSRFSFPLSYSAFQRRVHTFYLLLCPIALFFFCALYYWLNVCLYGKRVSNTKRIKVPLILSLNKQCIHSIRRFIIPPIVFICFRWCSYVISYWI